MKQYKTLSRRALALLPALALVLLMACNNGEKQTAGQQDNDEEPHTETVELTERQLQTVGIAIGPLEQRNLGSAVRANGELRLNAQDRAQVTPLAGGVVRKLLVREGQTVRRGQTVAYIENTELVSLQRELLTAQRELEYARQELARQRLLKSERAGVEKKLQQAEANCGVAEARVSGLRQQLQQLGVKPGGGTMTRLLPVATPIGGTVTRVNVAMGGYADPQQPLVEVANNGAVYAALAVFEKDLQRVTTGQRVDIALTYQQDTHIQGTVTSVDRTIDRQTRAATVRVGLDASQVKGRRLGDGMTVTGMVSTDRQQVQALPDGAIVSDGGRHYVFALDGQATENGQRVSRFRRVEVVTGQSELGHTAVSFPHPQKAGTQYVLRGAFYLASAQTDHGEHGH